jgi:hypothetical protein
MAGIFSYSRATDSQEAHEISITAFDSQHPETPGIALRAGPAQFF